MPAGGAATTLRQAALLALTLVGISLFSRGFFPVKPLLPGFRHAQGTATSAPGTVPVVTPPVEAPFARLVFILVDALRSDFAVGPDSNMDFVASIIGSGNALPFTAIAQAPTVTLPRLKALTTGSNPTFLDAFLNIAEDSSSAALEHVDSWVRQLAVSQDGTAGRRLAFAGDDTWLRLFPSKWFAWSEGVSSFFVSDTVTVDTNVTRHLDWLLVKDSQAAPVAGLGASWDALILHYLGMDHVGHLGGPKSPLMPSKQREMDGVVERVYRHLEERDAADGQKSLLVLVGDHGMTEMGNHGGSAEGETAAALLFAAPSVKLGSPVSPQKHSSSYHHYDVVNQIDLVPTLSVLLGLGIPTNSMGKVIESVLEAYGSRDPIDVLQENVEQIEAVLEAASPGATAELRPERTSTTHADLLTFLSAAQDRLMSTFGDYHLAPMVAGLAVLIASAAYSTLLASRLWCDETFSTRLSLGAGLLAYLGSFFATSFIEEEHEFWFWATASMLLILALRPTARGRDRACLVVAAATIRLMRAWPHNGQKDVPNTSVALLLTVSPILLRTLNLTSYLVALGVPLVTLARAARPSSRGTSSVSQLFVRAVTFALLATLSSLHIATLVASSLSPDSHAAEYIKAELGLGKVPLARVGYTLGAVTWAFARLARRADVASQEPYRVLQLSAIAITLMSLTRPANLFLFVLLWLQHYALSQSPLAPLTTAAATIALQHVSFFAFGGSNSLATVDLSQAYNGISSYSVVFVSLLTYLSNFSGPIFWALATAPSIDRTIYTITFHSLSLATLAASATHFRRHLFTWTVFSPALLYKGIWNVWVLWGTGVGLASLQ